MSCVSITAGCSTETNQENLFNDVERNPIPLRDIVIELAALRCMQVVDRFPEDPALA